MTEGKKFCPIHGGECREYRCKFYGESYQGNCVLVDAAAALTEWCEDAADSFVPGSIDPKQNQ